MPEKNLLKIEKKLLLATAEAFALKVDVCCNYDCQLRKFNKKDL